MSTIAITETMEQVHKHLEKYQALHKEISDEQDVLEQAVRERWGDVAPQDLLVQAELNSLSAARLKNLSNPKTNPWVDTTAQSDLFNNVPIRVPSMLMVRGKQKPYWECSIIDGLEWWRAREDAKAKEQDVYLVAAKAAGDASAFATSESEKLEDLVRRAQAEGVDPSTVMYAKAQE